MPDQQSSCCVGAVSGNVLVVDVLVDQIRDPETSYALRDEILLLMQSGEIRHVIIDLGRVQFLGSVGLLAFLAVRRELPGGSIVLCNVAEGPRTVLEVCLLVANDPNQTAAFEIEDSVEAALARLGRL